MKALLASAIAAALLAGTPALAWAQHDPAYQDAHGKKRNKHAAGKADRSHNAGKRDRNDRRAAAGAAGYGAGAKQERDPGRRKYGGAGAPAKYGPAGGYARGAPSSKYGYVPPKAETRRKYGRGDVPAKYGPSGGYARGVEGGKYGYVPPKYESDPYRRKYDRSDIPPKYSAVDKTWRDPNYGYGGWRSGDVLPAAYTDRRYAIPDFWSYDLGTPPRGYRWVRNGDDAILVNRKTGVILRVEEDVFG